MTVLPTATMARSGSTAAPLSALALGTITAGAIATAGITTAGSMIAATGVVTAAVGGTTVAAGEEVVAILVMASTAEVAGTMGTVVASMAVVGTTAVVVFMVVEDVTEFQVWRMAHPLRLLCAKGGKWPGANTVDSSAGGLLPDIRIPVGVMRLHLQLGRHNDSRLSEPAPPRGFVAVVSRIVVRVPVPDAFM